MFLLSEPGVEHAANPLAVLCEVLWKPGMSLLQLFGIWANSTYWLWTPYCALVNFWHKMEMPKNRLFAPFPTLPPRSASQRLDQQIIVPKPSLWFCSSAFRGRVLVTLYAVGQVGWGWWHSYPKGLNNNGNVAANICWVFTTFQELEPFHVVYLIQFSL